MKKILLYSVFLCLDQAVFCQSKISYKAYFDYNAGYCPGDSQYDHWVDFITSLDTASSNKYLKITMRGTYDMTGKTCSEKYAVRQIADALYNGYDATVNCDGNKWSIGTGCSDYNCGSAPDYIELTLNNYTCNCGVSYTIRPGITSQNWGGIATETCQAWYPGVSQYMMVDMERIYGVDNLSMLSLTPFDGCLSTQDIVAHVGNVGTNTVSNYMIGYSINGVSQTPVYVTTVINSDGLARVKLASSFGFSPSTAYAFKVWTYSPNSKSDSDPTNDTFIFNYTHTGTPTVPNVSKVISCGQGKVNINANTNDSIAWFDAADKGELLGLGRDLTTPFLTSTDTFYAESIKFLQSQMTFGTGFNNYTTFSNDPGEYNGGMLKLNVNDIFKITGVKVQSVFGNPTPHYKVYYREGGFAGYETDSSAWTRIFDAELTNGSTYNTIPFNLLLKPGKDYGLYITTDPINGEDIWVNYGAYAYTNPDLTVEGGTAIYGKFGSLGVYSPWTLDMEFLYEKACKSAYRQPVVVVVNPKPYGSELITGPGFKGQDHFVATGQPDIGEPGMLMNYELTNPSGYNNADYGSTWLIDDISLTTGYGKAVDKSMYTFNDPDSLGNGTLSFTPDTSLLDSNIVVKIKYGDLGPYFCDTVVTRVIHIAPAPKPGFKILATICEGSEVYFNNLSTIHSGTMTYKWYFSSKDSSDLFEPIHLFDSFGIYPVRLVITSLPYHIRRDTTIMVNVNGIPKVDFRIENACQGQSVVFNNQTPGNKNLINFTWDFGDKTPQSTLVDPVHKYSVPSMYKVSLKADLNGCIGTLTKNAYLFSKPVVDFTAPSVPKCQDESLFFLNNSYIYQGKMGAYWDFSDGNYSTLFNTNYKFDGPGTYAVKLKMISEFDCMDSMVKIVTIKPTPVVDFMVDKLCSRDSSRFTNLSTEFTGITSFYVWSFSDGPKQTLRHVSKKWNSHGPKTVKLSSVLSNGCVAETERLFDVLIQPEANFNMQNICSGESAVFVNLSRIEQGTMDFLWDFGDSSLTTTAPNPLHPYNVNKTQFFTVTLVANTFGGCVDTMTKIIKVNELPDCNFTYTPFDLIGNKAFRFTPANGTYTEYEWFFGEGGTSTNKSPIYQFLYPGIYTVRLRAKNSGGCECEQLIKINVNLSGVEDLYTGVVNLYPNPADEFIVIRLSGEEHGVANIYNHLGQIVYTVDLAETTQVMTGGFSSGLYIVEVVAGNKKVQTRISILH